MRIAISQLNLNVGNIKENLKKIISAIDKAKETSIDLIIFSEMTIPGYLPRDLLFHGSFLDEVNFAFQSIVEKSKTTGVGVLIGSTRHKQDKLYNTAYLIDGNKVSYQDKSLLPNYDVFDEKRYFTSAKEQKVLKFRGLKLGVHICEDGWNDKDFWENRNYDIDPVRELVKQEADILINLSASPYVVGKGEVRRKMVNNFCKKYQKTYIYVNQVGGVDELIFDGRSFVSNSKGDVVIEAKSFEEDFLYFKWEELDFEKEIEIQEEGLKAINDALVLGLKDYVYKNGFKKVVIGLSGGIDSAVVADLAVQAFGPENVLGIGMPSSYSSTHSVKDAQDLANNLGIEFRIRPIFNEFNSYVNSTKTYFNREMGPIAEENIQARIRGNILMEISNSEGHMVLSTGNKSELSVGYCTIYGDMCGGLSVISDVPKTIVFELAKYMNRNGERIPVNTITKPPSAELRPDQVDQDSLPPYEILDEILKALIEDYKSLEEIIAMGFNQDVVTKIAKLVHYNEYKRRQAAIGLKVTSKAFGYGRRYLIGNGYKPFIK